MVAGEGRVGISGATLPWRGAALPIPATPALSLAGEDRDKGRGEVRAEGPCPRQVGGVESSAGHGPGPAGTWARSGARRVGYGKPPLSEIAVAAMSWAGLDEAAGPSPGRGLWAMGRVRPRPRGKHRFARGRPRTFLRPVVGGLRARPSPRRPRPPSAPAQRRRRRVQPGHPVPRPPCGPAAAREQSPRGDGRHRDGRARAKGALRLSRGSQSAAAVPWARGRWHLASAPGRTGPTGEARRGEAAGYGTQHRTGEPEGTGASGRCVLAVHAVADPGSLGHPAREALSLTRPMRTNGPGSAGLNTMLAAPGPGRQEEVRTRGLRLATRAPRPPPPARPSVPPCTCQGQGRGADCRARGPSCQTPTEPWRPLPGELAGWLLRAPRLAHSLPGVSGQGSRVSRLRPSPAHTAFALAAPGTVPERAPSLPAPASLTRTSHPTLCPWCEAGFGPTRVCRRVRACV